MTRFIALVLLAFLLGGVCLLPTLDPVRMAAIRAGELLEEPTEPGGEPFWRSLIEGSAAEKTEDGKVRLRVRGYRMLLGGTTYKDMRLHARFFESVSRGLRSLAAEHDFELEIDQRMHKDHPGVLLLCNPDEGRLSIDAHFPDGTTASVSKEWRAPTGNSLLPPLIAVLFAVLFRRPLPALLAGVLVGSVLERLAFHSGLGSALEGVNRTFTHYLPAELLERSRLEILLFVACMMMLVGVVTRVGGIRGMMEHLARFAQDARRSQAVTFCMGLAVFFDHYANTILVGTTMRPLTDRFRVAREKLAYIVDSTAAPVAGLSLFSTWIAFEVSTFSPQLPEAGLAASQGYEIFLRTIPYRFYSLFALFLVALLVFTRRDFGPMLQAEKRARGGRVLRAGARPLIRGAGKGLQPAPGTRGRARLALVPLATFLLVTLGAILVRGGSGMDFGQDFGLETVSQLVFRGSGPAALLLGAAAGLAVAALMACAHGAARTVPSGAWAGLLSTLPALGLLLAAWTLGAVCRDVGTATYLAVILQESLNPLLLPCILFAVAGFIAFSTGSSWSTMTILLPLVVGISYEAGLSTPLGGEGMLVVAIGAVLEGAIFGDHCSPISDTTVMSSIASASDHVDHVRTQAPYALLAMVAALVCGYYPAVILGLPPVLSLLAGAVALTIFVRVYGKRADCGTDCGTRLISPEPQRFGTNQPGSGFVRTAAVRE